MPLCGTSNGVQAWSLVVSCEHASASWPEEAPPSGLDPSVFETHAAWDPGARPVAVFVAEQAAAPLFLGRFTRLFVDLNRSPTSPEAVPARAFGVDVPANAALSAEECAARVERFHAPYWNEVRAALQAGLQNAVRVLHLSVHSFVPVYGAKPRDLDLGLLFDPTRPLEQLIADRMYRALSGSFVVRENEPYDGRADALTTALRLELTADRYAGVEIEINQRLLPQIDRVASQIFDAVRLATATL